MKSADPVARLRKGFAFGRPGGSSMAHNLAVLHILTVTAFFTVCAVFLYFKLMHQLDNSAKDELRSEISSIRTLLYARNGLQLLREVMLDEEETEEPGNHCILVRILDREGRPVVECKNVRRPLPISVFPPPGDLQVKSFRAANGKPYLIQNAVLSDPISDTNGWRLQIGIDISEHQKLASGYRNYLILFALGGMLIAFPSSYLVVRRGLKPLSDLSATINEVSDSRLGTRVNPSRFPVEMQSLVGAFNAMMDDLESSFQRLSHYSGNLAHELRTPLNTLMLQSEIALSKERTAEGYREVIASAAEEYVHLATIIDRLLFLARADSKHNDLLREALEVEVEVAEVVDYFREAASSAGVSLESRGTAVIRADQTLFRTALSNLVDNAIAHTPPGGTVAVSTRWCNDGSVEVSVGDNGCGIDCGHLPLVFDRFYRVPAQEGERRAGTGLGLAIVKAIMLMHEGEVFIGSRPGKGTTVTLRFGNTLQG